MEDIIRKLVWDHIIFIMNRTHLSDEEKEKQLYKFFKWKTNYNIDWKWFMKNVVEDMNVMRFKEWPIDWSDRKDYYDRFVSNIVQNMMEQIVREKLFLDTKKRFKWIKKLLNILP